MRVVKRSGEVEDFDPSKAINAILRVGTSPEEAKAILESVKPYLYDGMTTEELYRRIRSALPEPKVTLSRRSWAGCSSRWATRFWCARS